MLTRHHRSFKISTREGMEKLFPSFFLSSYLSNAVCGAVYAMRCGAVRRG